MSQRVSAICLLAVAIALVFWTPSRAAEPASTPPPNSSGMPLEQMVRGDGTLDLHGYRGSVNAAGWRMSTDAKGAPRFARDGAANEPGTAEPSTVQSADDCWQGFDSEGMNNTVLAVALDGSGNLYAGGAFNVASGVNANYIAKWDGTSWSALGSGMDAPVLALAVDGSGDLYASGYFTAAGGAGANYVAKWNGTAWSALGSGMNNWVYALAVDGSGDLYAGGEFTVAGGVSADHVARWNGSSWSALGTGVNNAVNALTVSGSTLYAGGSFTVAGGGSASYIAKWNGSNWSALGSGVNNPVLALAVDGSSNLWAGGYFTIAGGVSANRVARWNGTVWSALGSGVDNAVNVLRVDGSGNVYAGGTFTTADGMSASRIARWNGTGWASLGFGVDNAVYALTLDGSGNLDVGGAFTSAGGVGVGRIARWNGTSWSALDGNMGFNNRVTSLVADGSGNVYAGGFFTVAGDADCSRVARWNGSFWSALGPGVNGAVNALAVDGSGNVYAGGDFTLAGGASANRVARWNGSSWSALGLGVSGVVNALAVDGSGNLYAGGTFTTAGGVSANNVARWDGVSWSPLFFGVNNNVAALAVDASGNLYAGGHFTTAGGGSASYIAKWDGSAWSSLGTGMNNVVYALKADGGGTLYAGGFFTSAGGVFATHVARWNGTNWSAVGSGIGNTVYALAKDSNGSLYAGGVFTNAGSVGAARVAQWNGNSWSALGSGVNNTVFALTVGAGDNLYAGGDFTTAGARPSLRIASFSGHPYYRDADGDGYGDLLNQTVFCSNSAPAGYATNSLDCDDGDPLTYAGASELCDGIDNDCNGLIDDGVQCACLYHHPGVIAWWKGEGVTSDETGQHDASFEGGASYAAGKVGQAFAFNGSNDVSVPDTPALRFSTAFTLEAWIKPNDVTQTRAIISKMGDVGNYAYALYLSTGGTLRCDVSDNGTTVDNLTSPGGALTAGTWSHVAATFDHGVERLYVNGAQVASKNSFASVYPGGRPLFVGGQYGGGQFFDGSIDEPTVHSHALSAGEILSTFNSGVRYATNLVALWSGEGNDKDATLHHSGIFAGGVLYGPGQVGQAFLFNGSNYLGAADAPALRFSTAFTIEAWIKPNDVTLPRQILTKSGDAGNYAYGIHVSPNGVLSMDVSGDGTVVDNLSSPDGALTAAAWSHVAATFDQGIATLYVNGAQVATKNSFVTSVYPGVRPLLIGAKYGGGQMFDGLIDQPAVYDRALTGAEVATIYQLNAQGLCGLGTVAVNEPLDAAGALVFAAPWPNPSTSVANLDFSLPAGATVRAEVFDISGRRVALPLKSQWLGPGFHRVPWDGTGTTGHRVAPGIYAVRISAGRISSIRRIVMMK